MDRDRAGYGSYSMPPDGQREGRIWIIQHASRWTETGQDMDHTACLQMDRDRAGYGSYSKPADGQRQGRIWIIQHAGRWTEAGQEMDHTACRQMDRGRVADAETPESIDRYNTKINKNVRLRVFVLTSYKKFSSENNDISSSSLLLHGL
jgi:hypothetical protein